MDGKVVDIAKVANRLEDQKQYIPLRELLEKNLPNLVANPPMQKKIRVMLGKSCYHSFDYPAAEKWYMEAFTMDTMEEDLYLRYVIGIPQLHQGNVVEGFTNYTYRWSIGDMHRFKHSMLTTGLKYIYNWRDLVDKHVVVIYEQGFGDEIMFSRAVPYAAELCASITWLASEPTAPFFAANCRENVTVVDGELADIPFHKFPSHCTHIITVGDLFTRFILHHGSVPPCPRYQAITPQTILSHLPKVGFAYSPGELGDTVEIRKVPLNVFRKMQDYAAMFSFQVDKEINVGVAMHHQITNYLDTANLLMGMDCVVTCDTSLAHLSLALGKPTMVVYDQYVDWRWKIGLYPEVQLTSLRDKHFEMRVREFVEGSCSRS